MNVDLKNLLYLSTIVAMLSGCASHSSVPEEIRSQSQGNPTIKEVRADVTQFENVNVLWGGVIASVENIDTRTRIEIVARDLYKSGRPRNNDYSPGRFIAEFQGFLDPAIFAKDREITINGAVQEIKQDSIGEYQYTFPIVRVNKHQLWEPREQYGFNPHPYYHDPFYHFYPYHHFYRYHHRHHHH